VQGSISTNTAAVTSVETTSSTGSVSGKALSGTGKRGKLPVFAEILARQSGDIGEAKDSENILEAGFNNPGEKGLNENSSQIETPVATLHLPELLRSKTELKPQSMAIAVSSQGKESEPESVVGKKDKKRDSKDVSNTPMRHEASKATRTSLADSRTPVLVSPLPIPTVQQSNFKQSSLSPSKPIVSKGVLSPPINASSVPSKEDGWQGSMLDIAASESKPGASAATTTFGLEHDRQISHPANVENSQSVPHELTPGEAESTSTPHRAENSMQANIIAGNNIGGRPPTITSEQIAALQAVTEKPKPQQKTEPLQVRSATSTPSMMSPTVNTDATNASGMHVNIPAAESVTAVMGTQYSAESKAQSVTTGSLFQHLDSGEPSATLLHANAHEVAVGMHDPSLGWVEIQAQSTAGHVSASLTTVTAEAHTSLAAEMPAITQYLADRNVNIHSLGIGTQGGGEGGGQQQSSSGYAEQEKYSQNRIASSGTTHPVQGAIEDVSAMETARTSSHISVRV
jgi:hypothetical protein